jgi:hypothetical protein
MMDSGGTVFFAVPPLKRLSFQLAVSPELTGLQAGT